MKLSRVIETAAQHLPQTPTHGGVGVGALTAPRQKVASVLEGEQRPDAVDGYAGRGLTYGQVEQQDQLLGEALTGLEKAHRAPFLYGTQVPEITLEDARDAFGAAHGQFQAEAQALDGLKISPVDCARFAVEAGGNAVGGGLFGLFISPVVGWLIPGARMTQMVKPCIAAGIGLAVAATAKQHWDEAAPEREQRRQQQKNFEELARMSKTLEANTNAWLNSVKKT